MRRHLTVYGQTVDVMVERMFPGCWIAHELDYDLGRPVQQAESEDEALEGLLEQLEAR